MFKSVRSVCGPVGANRSNISPKNVHFNKRIKMKIAIQMNIVILGLQV